MRKLRNKLLTSLFFFSLAICQAQHIERGQSNYSDFELFFQKGFKSIELVSKNFRISKTVTNVELGLDEYKINTKLVLIPIKNINYDSIRIILPLLYDIYSENNQEEFNRRRKSGEGYNRYKFKANGDIVLCKYDSTPIMINKDMQLENCYFDFYVRNTDTVEIEIKYYIEYFYSKVDYFSGLGEYEERSTLAGFIPNTKYRIDTFELYFNNNIPEAISVYIDSVKIGERKIVKEYNVVSKENKLIQISFNPDNYLVSKDYLEHTLNEEQLKVSNKKWKVLFDKDITSSVRIEKEDVIEVLNVYNERIYEMFILLDSVTLSNREEKTFIVPISITTQLYDSKTDSIYSETKTELVKFYTEKFISKAFAHNIGYATPFIVSSDPYIINDFFNNDTQEPYNFYEPKILKISIRIEEQFDTPISIAEIFLLKVE